MSAPLHYRFDQPPTPLPTAPLPAGVQPAEDGETPHAVFGASSTSIWMNCPGSYRLLEAARAAGAVPAKDAGSSYAREGTAAHACAEVMIREALVAGGLLRALDLAGIAAAVPIETAAAQGITLSDPDDFRLAVATYVCDCLALIGANSTAGCLSVRVGVEHFVNLTHLYDLHDWTLPAGISAAELAQAVPLYGTADFILATPRGLYLRDYKHGAGVSVQAEGNSQLMYYALGAIEALRASGLSVPDGYMVRAAIVQPRAGGEAIRETRWTAAELDAFGARLVAAAAAAYQPAARLAPGSWCQFCKAAQAPCPAMAERAREAARKAFGVLNDLDVDCRGKSQSLVDTMRVMPADELARHARELPILAEWQKVVQQALTARLARGEKIPGYKAVRGRAMRKWADGFDVGAVDDALANESPYGVDADAIEAALLRRGLVSPAQAEKAAKTNPVVDRFFKSVLADQIVRPEGALTYAPEDDPRPAADLSSGFGQLDADGNEI